MEDGNYNPALRELSFLVGRWNAELSNAAFINGKSDIEVNIGWVKDGSALSIEQGSKDNLFGHAVWIVGRDDEDDNYRVLYSDARGVSRVYYMSFSGSVWKIWRDINPEFEQRFEGRIDKDGKTIIATWEKSHDGGKTWEKDFDMTYTRLGD